MAQPQALQGLGRDGGAELPSGPLTACDVAAHVFVPKCSACHGPGGQKPELTAEAVKTSLVGVSNGVGKVYVAASDPSGSLLWRKVAGVMAADEGARMPPTSILEADLVVLVERWISEGAAVDCTTTTTAAPERYHPEAWAEPTNHGEALKMGLQDCRQCHGNDLSGQVGPSCDSCHQEGWRSNCTFCHGGTDNPSGAPPRDLTGATVKELLSFQAHTPHVSASNHAPYDCIQCHQEPMDVLSLEHVFDSTPGRAEVRFSNGLSRAGRYDGDGACANLYCHGNGDGVLGAFTHTEAPNCTSCHGGMASPNTWARMSGEHEKHLDEELECQDCHAATVSDPTTILDPSLHVNGQKDVVLGPSTMTRANGTCSGTCHGERHNSRRW